MKVTVDQAFWDLFPTARITVMSLYGIDNTVDEAKDPYFKELLDKGAKRAWEFIDEENYTQSGFVQEWRQAFSKFKTKKGVRCSIEALLKRVNSGNPVSSINKLVDIYNTASLKYALPCGAEDLDSFVGDLKLTITKGGDKFIPLGSEEEDNTLPNELCYIDNEGAVCRCFNWRDGARTMVKDETKNSFLIMELLDNRLEELNSALDYISENAKKYLNADVEKYILDINNPEIVLK